MSRVASMPSRVLSAPGAGVAAFQAWLSLHRPVGARWAVALDLSGPLRGATLSGPEGSARVGAYLAGLTLLARVTRPGADFLVTAGGGAAFVDVRATGAVYARADGTFEATGWLKLGVRAVIGAATSRVALQFAGNDAGNWGRPFLGGFALADVSWR